jgi:hypothetical protein
MAELTVYTIDEDGVDPTFVAATAGGDYAIVNNHARTFLHIKNGHSSPQSVTIKGKIESNQGELNDNTVSVTNAEERLIPIRVWEKDAANRVDFEYSAVTLLNVAVVQVGD